MTASAGGARIGVDLGGTKIEALMLDAANRVLAGPFRVATPRQDYGATIVAVGDLVARLESTASTSGTSVGIGIPGSIARSTGRVQNANSVWLNGKPLLRDMEERLGARVRLANDANCFALSEALDGAGAGVRTVLGVIIGTGCGGGLVIDGKLLDGPMGIGGEWGHNPLPWAQPDEFPGPLCWCGRHGCMETWVSGPGLAAQYAGLTGQAVTAEEVAQRARDGDADAEALLVRHTSQLARGLAHVANIIDPDVIVLGGGLSQLQHLYQDLPPAVAPHLFTDQPAVDIRPPKWGDSSGVRGAAWLWET